MFEDIKTEFEPIFLQKWKLCKSCLCNRIDPVDKHPQTCLVPFYLIIWSPCYLRSPGPSFLVIKCYKVFWFEPQEVHNPLHISNKWLGVLSLYLPVYYATTLNRKILNHASIYCICRSKRLTQSRKKHLRYHITRSFGNTRKHNHLLINPARRNNYYRRMCWLE